MEVKVLTISENILGANEKKARIGVIEGDVASTIDANKVEELDWI